jgi:hypothetical protein
MRININVVTSRPIASIISSRVVASVSSSRLRANVMLKPIIFGDYVLVMDDYFLEEYVVPTNS